MNSLPTSHPSASIQTSGRVGAHDDQSWAAMAMRQKTSQHPYDVLSLAAVHPRTLSLSAEGDLFSETVDEDPRKARMRAEAVLLVSKSPLSPRKLASLASLPDATSARTAVRSLNELYDQMGRAMRVETIAGGYRLMTRSTLAPWLSRLSHLPSPLRLSTPMLETLSVVAYRQPVSRADAEAIRGVACGELLRQLMDRDLVRIAGRSEELGRPYLYGTTRHFLQIFGLPNTDSLPPIRWQTLTDDSDNISPEEDSPEDHAVIIDCPTEPAAEFVDTEFGSPEIFSEESTATVTDDPKNLNGNSAVDPKNVSGDTVVDPKNVIEDEEDDLYEGETDGDWDDDDWDDPDDEDEDDDEEDEDDESGDDDIDDDLEDDDWEEVDDEESDEDIDDDEDLVEKFDELDEDDEEEEDDDWGSDDDTDDDDEEEDNWD